MKAEELLGHTVSSALLQDLRSEYGAYRTSSLPGRTYHVFTGGIEIAVDPETHNVETVFVYPSAKMALPEDVDLMQHRSAIQMRLGRPHKSVDEDSEHFDVWHLGTLRLWINYDDNGCPHHATIKV